MEGLSLHPIENRLFRLSPGYDLKWLSLLPPGKRTALRKFTRASGYAAILLPRRSGRDGIKLVCRETALLLQGLRCAGPLPERLMSSCDVQLQRAVGELVLDGVLQVEHEERFICGAKAWPAVCSCPPASAPHNYLSRISQAALQYAEALAIDDVNRLCGRLYFYNRIPLCTGWERRFSSREAIAAFLGLDVSGHPRRLCKSWIRVNAAEANAAWFSWRSRHQRQNHDVRDCRFKLYVSPTPDETGSAFSAVTEILNDSTALGLKIGCDAAGLLRPDKLVIYFPDLNSLQATASELARRLSGCEAQGVPFTASLTDDGLLSWGLDPPPQENAQSVGNPESWRVWVTARLAKALISARRVAEPVIEPWQFASGRMRFHGVDPDTWSPDPDIRFD